jgi:acyl carrier protein
VVPAPDEPLFESGFLDSFALVDVVAALEKQFSIEIPDADLHPQKFASVARIREYVEKR